MNLYFKDSNSDKVLYGADEGFVPNIGDEVRIYGKWFKVESRAFFCDSDDPEYCCVVWVEEYDK